MALSSQLTADHFSSPKELKEAQHKGWLAGVALRLGCGGVTRNPYEKGTDVYLEWEVGFDLGFAG